MKAEATIKILRRALCLIAMGAYAFFLFCWTLLGLGYAFETWLGLPWQPIIISIFLRWVPAAIYFYLRHRPGYISRSRRVCAVALSVASISTSYFLICFSADALSKFAQDFLECTIDMWPAIVMLLTVTSRSTRFPNSLRNVATPIASP